MTDILTRLLPKTECYKSGDIHKTKRNGIKESEKNGSFGNDILSGFMHSINTHLQEAKIKVTR